MKRYVKRKHVVVGVVLLSVSLACGGAGGFIDQLIKSYNWPGASCLINIWVFRGSCFMPPQPRCAAGCTHGHKVKNSDGTCTWIRNSFEYACGMEIPDDQRNVIDCSDGPECLASSTVPNHLIGWDAGPRDTVPANVVSISPRNGKLLAAGEGVAIKFNETMDATSVTLSGDMVAEAGPYSFSRSADQFVYNDTLTIPPSAEWAPGWRNVSIDLKDNTGHPSALSLSWYVLAPGQSPVPDFSSCGCASRWFLPYQVQFTASGGVPPYTWRISGIAPPYDADVFRATGLLFGGPTKCPLCSYTFDICVADALGSETCHGATWESGL